MGSLFLFGIGLIVLIGLGLLFYWWFEGKDAVGSKEVEVIVWPDFQSTRLGNGRAITIFLPPGYEKGRERYPVLYMNDGQDVEAFRLEEQLNHLYEEKQIKGLIVVAIPANEDRLQEYGTAGYPNAQRFGARADRYTDFVVNELLPEVNGRFRTRIEPEYQAFLGVSLGGLSAFDIVWHHPKQFSSVGVMSGSFWWRSAADQNESLDLEPNLLIMHQLVARNKRNSGIRAWFEAGTMDESSDRDQNGVIDAIQDTVELIEILEQQGFRRGEELFYVEVDGGEHNYETWANQLPDFLIWLSGSW